MISRKILSRALCTALTLWLSAEVNAHASVIVVTPSSLNGWAPNLTDPLTGQVNFVTGPAAPPLGVGSVQLVAGNGVAGGDESAQIRNTLYSGTPLSALTVLSYSTYVTSWNGQQAPYLTLFLDTDKNGSFDDRLFFEPAYQTPTSGNPSLPNQGDPATNTWQTWNAFAGGWWNEKGDFNPGVDTGSVLGVHSISDYLALYPDATIVNTDDTTPLGGVRFSSGFASAEDLFNTNVDNFSIRKSTDTETTTYDFEPEQLSAVPEPASLALITLGGLGLMGYSWRRRKPVIA